MTRDSKDRHTWRQIPSHAVEEARRRAGLENAEAAAVKDKSEPKTRSSWLPLLKLPGVRRTAIKAVDGNQSKPRNPGNPRDPKALGQQNFQGGSTLPWQPNQPAAPREQGPVVRSNTVVVDPEYLGSASGAGSSAAAHFSAAISGLGADVDDAPTEPMPAVLIPSAPVFVSSGRPPSVREALATIDAAAAQRSARLHSVPTPAHYAKSGEVRKEAFDVIDAAIQREHAAGVDRKPQAPASQLQREHSRSAQPQSASREHARSAQQQSSASSREQASNAQPQSAAREHARSAQQQSSASSREQASNAQPQSAAREHERSALLQAMRTPSLTAAPGSAAAASRPAPVIAMAGPVTSAQQPMAAGRIQPESSKPSPAAAPALAAAAPAPAPREQVFRQNALRAKSEEPVAQPLPEVTGSGWSVLLVLSTLLMIGLGLAYVGRVEQTSIASGILQVSGGPRPVLAQTSGPVLSLDVRPGDSVKQGQTIARVDATDLTAREQRDVAQLTLVKLEKERISAAELGRLQADQRALRQKRGLLEERAHLKSDAVRDRRERMEQVQHAAHEGVATQGDALAVREAERSASEELLLIRQQITDIDMQLTEAQKNYQATLERLRHDIDSATNSLAETRTLLQTTEIRAPVAGRVESLQVAQGQVISSGTVLARIVPDGTISSAVVFAPAKDASFLREGLDASLEFASLPVSEFGKAPARVTRVSKDVASGDEILSALGRGLEEPVIRVELELLPSEQLRRVQDKLRSGERLTARLNTRDRRMITLLFDFMRKWYEP